jgi:hypothetical protein
MQLSKSARPRLTLFPTATVGLVFLVAAAPPNEMQGLGSRDTFGSAALSSAEVKEILDQVEDSAYDIADDWQTELHIRRVDLGASQVEAKR